MTDTSTIASLNSYIVISSLDGDPNAVVEIFLFVLDVQHEEVLPGVP